MWQQDRNVHPSNWPPALSRLMLLSHEAIYRSLFIQARRVLKKELREKDGPATEGTDTYLDGFLVNQDFHGSASIAGFNPI